MIILNGLEFNERRIFLIPEYFDDLATETVYHLPGYESARYSRVYGAFIRQYPKYQTSIGE